jgi:hypothetical protein
VARCDLFGCEGRDALALQKISAYEVARLDAESYVNASKDFSLLDRFTGR